MSAGLLLGLFEGQVLTDFSDQHVCVCGETGSGKDMAAVLPWCASWPGSMLVADPKNGDTYGRTHQWRRTFSDIVVYAPTWERSADINVLDTIRLGTVYEYMDTQHIAASLTAPQYRAIASDAGMHFGQMAETVFIGSILHTLYTSPRKSLPGVLEWVTSCGDDLADVVRALVESKHLGTQVHAIIASIGKEISHIEARELGSIWSTMMRGLHVYRDPRIAQHSDRTTVPLDALQSGSRPVTMYLIAPSPEHLAVLHPLYRVVMETIVQVTMRQKVRRARHQMLVVWNEFPSFGWMRSIEVDIATVREYGWRLCLICQDLHQLWKTYGEDTGIWGNVGIKAFFGVSHDLSAKRICENMIGWQTVEREVVTTDQSGWVRRDRSSHPQRSRELLLQPSELMQMPKNDMLLIVNGIPPILGQKLWYDRQRQLRRRIVD